MRTFRKLVIAPVGQGLTANPLALATTGLNGLAASAGELAAAADFDGAELADFELLAGFAVAPVLDALVELYLLPTMDGTNFAHGTDGAAALSDRNCLVGAFKVQAQTAAHRMFLLRAQIPLGKFRPLLINRTTQAFAASGNVLTARPFRVLSDASPA